MEILGPEENVRTRGTTIHPMMGREGEGGNPTTVIMRSQPVDAMRVAVLTLALQWGSFLEEEELQACNPASQQLWKEAT